MPGPGPRTREQRRLCQEQQPPEPENRHVQIPLLPPQIRREVPNYHEIYFFFPLSEKRQRRRSFFTLPSVVPPHPVSAAGQALPALSQSIGRSAPSPGSRTCPVPRQALLQNHLPKVTPLYSWCLFAPSGLFSPLLSAPPGVFPLSARSGRRQDNSSTHLPCVPCARLQHLRWCWWRYQHLGCLWVTWNWESAFELSPLPSLAPWLAPPGTGTARDQKSNVAQKH